MADRPLSERRMPSSFDDNHDFYNESVLQKVTRKLKAEPLVPLGCLLTVGAFVNAYRAMRRGDHNQVQRMFRARVLAQGFTVIAIVAGGIYYGAERRKERELWKVQQAQVDEDKRLKWIRELEARDAEEKALRERMDRRRRRTDGSSKADKAEMADKTKKGPSSAGPVEAGAAPVGAGKEGSGVLPSLASQVGWKIGERWPDEKPQPVDPNAAKK